MRGADQVAGARHQELTGRPIEPASGVRADVEPRRDPRTVATQDQGFGIAIHHAAGFGEAVIGNLFEGDERFGHGLACDGVNPNAA